MNAFEERTIENSVSAQKRAEVKLDSPRVSAKQTVRRPADASTGMPDGFLSTLLLTLLLMVATLFLLFARLTDRPTSLPALSSAMSTWLNLESIAPAAETPFVESFSPTASGEVVAQESSGALSGVDTEATAQALSVPTTEQLRDSSAAEATSVEEPSAEVATVRQIEGNIGEPALALLHQSDFSRATFPLAVDNQQSQNTWLMGFVPGENVYRIRVFPGYVAWSTLGYELSPPFRIETSVTVIMSEECSTQIGPDEVGSDEESVTSVPQEESQNNECAGEEQPLGYAGLLARYQDSMNFYLFNVDGKGQSQLLSQINGEWTTLLPWTPTANVNSAGKPNLLAVKDDEQFLTFYINGYPIHEVEPMLAPGLVGLAGGTRVQHPAESNFEWIRIYGSQ